MSSLRLAALAAFLGYAAIWCAGAHAQVYRIVGPDGRVTFSDRPPPEGQATPAPSLPLPAAAGYSGSASLPSELRAVTARFPVTLYTGNDCQPCSLARNFLIARGVPFAERTISTEADVRALQQLSGAARLPFATLGGQFLRGFAESEWSQYLDAAGYPKVSALPPTYRNPPPAPMVAIQAPRPVEPQGRPAQAEAQPTDPLPSDPSPSNPLGIRF